MTPTPSPTSPLDGLAPTAAEVTRLRNDLADRAAAGGLLDVAHRRVDSPIGPLLVAATPRGVVRVAFELEDHDAVLASLAETISPRVLEAPARLDDVARRLDAYFAGTSADLDVDVDLRLVTPFRRTVLDHLLEVPYGATTSYRDLAAAAGNPGAVRAVGTACATNPVPIVVPCHRVLRTDGTIGQYRGGTEAKRLLLALEAA